MSDGPFTDFEQEDKTLIRSQLQKVSPEDGEPTETFQVRHVEGIG